MPCRGCQPPIPPCAAFTDDQSGSGYCFCGHGAPEHQPERVIRTFPPRGGMPGSACAAFSSDDPIVDYHQLCDCGSAYSAHQPSPAAPPSSNSAVAPSQTSADTRAAGPSHPRPPTSQQWVGGPSYPPHATHQQRAGGPSHPPPATSQSWAAAPSHLPPPTSQQLAAPLPSQPSVPTIIPYQSFIAGNQPVQVPAPTTTTGQERRSYQRARNANRTTNVVPRNQTLSLSITMVIVPQDIVREAPLTAPVAVVDSIPKAKLGPFLDAFEAQNLTKSFVLTGITQNTSQLLFVQICQRFSSMVSKARSRGFFVFPHNDWEIPETTALPGLTAPQQKKVVTDLPFHLLKPSIHGPAKRYTLKYDPVLALTDFTRAKLMKRLADPRNSGHVVLFVCPKFGYILRGTENPPHLCLADRMNSAIWRADYQENLELSAATQQELDEEYAQRFGWTHCHNDCPNDGKYHDEEPPVEHSSDSEEYRPDSSRPVQGSWGGGDWNRTDWGQVVPHHPPQRRGRSLSETSQAGTSPPSHPTHPLPGAEQEPTPQDPPVIYPTFQDFEDAITDTENDDRWSFSMSALSVEDAAHGLVAILKEAASRGFDSELVLRADRHPNMFSISRGFTFITLLRASFWDFRAGREGRDCAGRGVVRDILFTALDIAADDVLTVPDVDGYRTLRVSPLGVDPGSLTQIKIVAMISIMVMLKTHSLPTSISPALFIQAMDSDKRVLDNDDWLKKIYPGLHETLSLLPVDGLFPNNAPQVICLVNMIFGDQRIAGINALDNERRNEIRHALRRGGELGAKEDTLIQSEEFQRFCGTFEDVFLKGPKSFKQMISPSFTELVTKCYSQIVTSPQDVIPEIVYKFIGQPSSENPRPSESYLTAMGTVVERYLNGAGHVRPDDMSSFGFSIDVEGDPRSFRARMFTYALNGQRILPIGGFKVEVYFVLPANEECEDSFLPPTLHSCTQTIDFRLNKKLRDFLDGPPAPADQDTDFDFLIHTALIPRNGGFEYNL